MIWMIAVLYGPALGTGISPNIRTDLYAGVAYEADSEQLIYTEVHQDLFENELHVSTSTDYYDAQKQLIAQRKLNFRRSRIAPDFHTKDLRTGYEEGAQKIDDTHVRLYFRVNAASPITEKTIAVPAPMVIDGGFNQYIKAHWEELQLGQVLTFHFTVSARLDYFTLRAVKTSSELHQVSITVEPENALIRWLVDPIVIHYDPSTHRILSYEGKSNIADEDGKNFIAKLIYPDKGP